MVAAMRTATRDLIAGRTPGACVVVAELGVNHDGLIERALELVECAHRAGADAIKLQLFDAAELCSVRYRAEELEMLLALQLSEAQQELICAAARRLGLCVIATAFDEGSVRLAERLEVPVIKIGSGEVTHTPLLEAIGRLEKPAILSTGGCGCSDIDRAAAALLRSGCPKLSLLHCVSAYPPPDVELNLRMIETLRRHYPDCPVGFSDHTLGVEAAVGAVALGACIVEKHLTLDPRAPGPDHAASADPETFAATVRGIRRMECMLGDGRKRVQACEGVIGRSIVAARDLPAGHHLGPADIRFKRPGTGLRPYEADRVVGGWLRRAVVRDEILRPQDVSCEPVEEAAPATVP